MAAKPTTWPLEGRVAVLTAGTGGIGKHTAIGLARRGAVVVVTGRDSARGSAAAEEIASRAEVDRPMVRSLTADLSRLSDVRRLASDVLGQLPRLHLLVNNAGGNYKTHQITEDGLEASLAMNAVSPFLLTRLLLARMAETAAADPHAPSPRIVMVSTSAHKMVSRLDRAFADLNSEQGPFVGMTAYARAKLLGLMAGYELADQAGAVTLTAVDPGPADTAMSRGMDREFFPRHMRAVWPLYYRLGPARRTPETACASVITAAISPELEGRTGLYLDSRGRPAKSSRISRDPAGTARALETLDRLGLNAGHDRSFRLRRS